MFCKQCGASISDTALFCNSCGAHVVKQAQPQAQPQQAYQAQPQPQQAYQPQPQPQQAYQPQPQPQQAYQAQPQPQPQAQPQPQPQQAYQAQPQPQQAYQAQPQQAYQQQYQQQNYQPPQPKDNRKLFSIFAYIPFFWLFGLCSSPEKFDEDVKFHVKQGIVTTIIYGVLMTVAIIRCVIMCMTDMTGGIIFLMVCDYLIANGVGALYCVLGIINAAKGKKKILPLLEYFIKK